MAKTTAPPVMVPQMTYLPAPLVEQLEARAAQLGLSRSACMRHLLTLALDPQPPRWPQAAPPLLPLQQGWPAAA